MGIDLSPDSEMPRMDSTIALLSHTKKNSNDTQRIKDVDFENRKILWFAHSKKVSVHRFACLGPGDILATGGTNKMSVHCLNGLARVRPIYRRTEMLKVGNYQIKLTFKEITTAEERESYEKLADFHYRGDVLHGRRVPIIASVQHPFLPRVVGYAEISTTFIMNKPRSTVLNAPFSDGNGISWKAWDLRAMRTKTNLICRVARCVVYPELRGLGLSRMLLENACRYATRHWQVGRLKPYFIEITADMLKYLPFAEKAGMHFLGMTQGNLSRVKTDMAYILKNYERVKDREILREESAGIVDLQVGYAAKLKHIMANGGPKLKEAFRLMDFKRNYVTSKQYDALHGLLRLPKPTYLKGLTPTAERFVTERVNTLAIKRPEDLEIGIRRKSLASAIKLSELTIRVTAKVPQTRKTRAIQEAFGIKSDQLEYDLISKLSLELAPRSTMLIVGPSGSGKTILLSALSESSMYFQRHPNSRVRINGRIFRPANTKVGVLRKIGSEKPLVELFRGSSIERAIYLLNMAGLSEAYLYLKRFQELSAGQQYRAMIAKMIDRECNLWIADEFCSALDPMTAYIVGENLRSLARKFGATVIVAAAHWNYFVHTLRPDVVVYLMLGGGHRIFSGAEFLRTSRQLQAGKIK